MQISNSNALPMQPNTDSLSAPASSRWPSLTGRVLWRPVAALSLAGIALGMLAVSLMPTRKTFAYAAVVQAMQQVKTIHWVVQSSGPEQPGAGAGQNGRRIKMDTWARLDRPAYAILMTPNGSMRTLMAPGGMRTISNGQVMLNIPMPFLEGDAKRQEQGLRRFILDQVLSPQKDEAAAAKEGGDPALLPDKADSELKQEETILNGKPAVRFYGEWKSEDWKFALSLWVDPDTHLVVRSESTMTNPKPGQPDVHAVADQFRYNEPPPAGIFDVPQGKAGIPTIKMPE